MFSSNRIHVVWAAFALAAAMLLAATLHAADVKTRMKERLPQIVALKSEGVVGENHQGYLEAVGGSLKGADVIQAENADRREVYSEIANRTGATVEQVGARAALARWENAAKGDWFKKADGSWVQR
ncbi:MAG: YdbL family protein [Desulfobacterales bacterium]